MTEIDSIAPTRGGGMGDIEGSGASGYGGAGRMLSQLLTEMDGVQEMQGVMVVSSQTNRADMIDTALLRPGRFDRIVYVPNPDRNTRVRILEIHTRGKPISRDIDLSKIAEQTEGFSGADVTAQIPNTAISLVLHGTFQKYPTPEDPTKTFIRRDCIVTTF